MRALLLALTSAAFLACDSVPSADTFKLVPLPADVTQGPATWAAQTKAGQVFVSTSNGSFLQLVDGGWEPRSPEMLRGVVDFQQGETFAYPSLQEPLYVARGDGFVLVEPEVRVPNLAQFSNVGSGALRGRDATGTWWATSAPTFGGFEGKQNVARLPAGATEWVLTEVPLVNVGQTIPAANAVLTSDGRLFFRPYNSGVWEVDLASEQMVERVPCAEPLFLPSGPDYQPCDEDVYLTAGRGGELFALNTKRELWRLGAGETTASLVTKGPPPSLEVKNLDGTNRYSPGEPSRYVDARGRVWLSFRWGNNDTDDVTYLYVADPAKGDTWTFLSNELPRNVTLFGNGGDPLIANTSLDTGLLVFRVSY